MKRLASLTLALALGASSVSAFAADKNFDKITVNNMVLEDAHTITVNDKVMIPLRAIAEKLGFDVTWNGESRKIELTKLPVYITCLIGTDGYTFSRTAPMKLGSAPVIYENKTYVPLNFVDEILDGSYTTDNGLAISYGEIAEEDSGRSVYVKEKTEDGFLIEDFEMGEVKLIVSADTEIVNANGEKIGADDIDTDMELTVTYSDVMTMSLPPITNAVKIAVTNETKKAVISGEVTEVIEDNGAIMLTIGDNEKIVTIGEDTKITNTAGEEVEAKFEIGMTVRALTKGMATMSIPPQYPVSAVIICD